MSRQPDARIEPQGFMVVVGHGDRIHFLDWTAVNSPPPDGGRPGIVLVHGLSATAWIWAPVARRLAGVRRTVAIDLPGHGLSDAPTSVEAYAPDALAETVVAAAEGARMVALEAFSDGGGEPGERRAVIVGHGFGGSVAAWAAIRLGPRCAGLVLVDGGWESLPEATGMEPEEFMRTTEEPPEVMRSLAAYLTDRREFDPATWDDDQERAARAAVVELPVGRIVPSVRPHSLEATVRTAFAYDPRAVLPEVRAPIVALAAADDDERTHTGALERTQAVLAAAGRPPIRVIRFPSNGHNLMRYRPTEVAAAILEAGR
jgi:pimeloyl-ACP methyl ester carboxylesterase